MSRRIISHQCLKLASNKKPLEGTLTPECHERIQHWEQRQEQGLQRAGDVFSQKLNEIKPERVEAVRKQYEHVRDSMAKRIEDFHNEHKERIGELMPPIKETTLKKYNSPDQELVKGGTYQYIAKMRKKLPKTEDFYKLVLACRRFWDTLTEAKPIVTPPECPITASTCMCVNISGTGPFRRYVCQRRQLDDWSRWSRI